MSTENCYKTETPQQPASFRNVGSIVFNFFSTTSSISECQERQEEKKDPFLKRALRALNLGDSPANGDGSSGTGNGNGPRGNGNESRNGSHGTENKSQKKPEDQSLSSWLGATHTIVTRLDGNTTGMASLFTGRKKERNKSFELKSQGRTFFQKDLQPYFSSNWFAKQQKEFLNKKLNKKSYMQIIKDTFNEQKNAAAAKSTAHPTPHPPVAAAKSTPHSTPPAAKSTPHPAPHPAVVVKPTHPAPHPAPVKHAGGKIMEKTWSEGELKGSGKKTGAAAAATPVKKTGAPATPMAATPVATKPVAAAAVAAATHGTVATTPAKPGTVATTAATPVAASTDPFDQIYKQYICLYIAFRYSFVHNGRNVMDNLAYLILYRIENNHEHFSSEEFDFICNKINIFLYPVDELGTLKSGGGWFKPKTPEAEKAIAAAARAKAREKEARNAVTHAVTHAVTTAVTEKLHTIKAAVGETVAAAKERLKSGVLGNVVERIKARPAELISTGIDFFTTEEQFWELSKTHRLLIDINKDGLIEDPACELLKKLEKEKNQKGGGEDNVEVADTEEDPLAKAKTECPKEQEKHQFMCLDRNEVIVKILKYLNNLDEVINLTNYKNYILMIRDNAQLLTADDKAAAVAEKKAEVDAAAATVKAKNNAKVDAAKAKVDKNAAEKAEVVKNKQLKNAAKAVGELTKAAKKAKEQMEKDKEKDKKKAEEAKKKAEKAAKKKHGGGKKKKKKEKKQENIKPKEARDPKYAEDNAKNREKRPVGQTAAIPKVPTGNNTGNPAAAAAAAAAVPSPSSGEAKSHMVTPNAAIGEGARKPNYLISNDNKKLFVKFLLISLKYILEIAKEDPVNKADPKSNSTCAKPHNATVVPNAHNGAKPPAPNTHNGTPAVKQPNAAKPAHVPNAAKPAKPANAAHVPPAKPAHANAKPAKPPAHPKKGGFESRPGKILYKKRYYNIHGTGNKKRYINSKVHGIVFLKDIRQWQKVNL